VGGSSWELAGDASAPQGKAAPPGGGMAPPPGGMNAGISSSMNESCTIPPSNNEEIVNGRQQTGGHTYIDKRRQLGWTD